MKNRLCEAQVFIKDKFIPRKCQDEATSEIKVEYGKIPVCTYHKYLYNKAMDKLNEVKNK